MGGLAGVRFGKMLVVAFHLYLGTLTIDFDPAPFKFVTV